MFVFSNAYCTGTFKAMDTSKSVQITFLDFDLSYCCDYVEIFDGRSSRDTITWVNLSSIRVLLGLFEDIFE